MLLQKQGPHGKVRYVTLGVTLDIAEGKKLKVANANTNTQWTRKGLPISKGRKKMITLMEIMAMSGL